MVVIEYIKTHYADILAIIGGVVAVASAIVKITPSTKDDTVLGKIVSVLVYFSLYNKDGSRNQERWEKMERDAKLFKATMDANIPKVANENPIMHKYAVAIIGRGNCRHNHGQERNSKH